MAPGGKQEDGQGPWTKEARAQFMKKQAGQYFDPCHEAAERTYRCLTRNEGDREMCRDYFEAYRDCKRDWLDKWKEEKQRRALELLGLAKSEK